MHEPTSVDKHKHTHTQSDSHTLNDTLATRGHLRLEPGLLSLPHSHGHTPTTPERIELEYCMPPPHTHLLCTVMLCW